MKSLEKKLLEKIMRENDFQRVGRGSIYVDSYSEEIEEMDTNLYVVKIGKFYISSVEREDCSGDMKLVLTEDLQKARWLYKEKADIFVKLFNAEKLELNIELRDVKNEEFEGDK